MSDTNEHKCLVNALAAAQGEFPEIARDVTVDTGKYSYQYATLSTILAACRPVLAKHGIAIIWTYEQGERGTLVICKLLCGQEAIQSSLPIFVNAGDGMQALGSALTYAKRYLLMGLLGISPETDDDGQAAQPVQQARSQPRSKPAAPKKTPQKAPAPQAAPPTILEQLRNRAEKCEMPADLIELIKNTESWDKAQDILMDCWDAYSDVIRAHRDSGNWNKEQCDEVRRAIEAALIRMDLNQQAEETFNGQAQEAEDGSDRSEAGEATGGSSEAHNGGAG